MDASGTLAPTRLRRLRECMSDMGVGAVLTADPINIAYATGVRNMSVYSMMGATRFVLIPVEGPVVLWDFPGSEHLSAEHTTVDETRTAPGLTALSGPTYVAQAARFAQDVGAILHGAQSGTSRLSVERFDHPVTDALRAAGMQLDDATRVFVEARKIKDPSEVDVMRDAMAHVVAGIDVLRETIEPGRTEVEIWAELHRHLIATGGEYISTRLAQADHRTFPYFREASSYVVGAGDLFCIDSDAIGVGGYGVDFSRTFLCGDQPATAEQRDLHALAYDQLAHNASLLEAGRSFESYSREAWPMPARFEPYRYSCLAHGLGMSGEYPYVPIHDTAGPFALPGAFEPGMVICVESYVGDRETAQGIKLEDQYLILDDGVERMSETAFDDRLGG